MIGPRSRSPSLPRSRPLPLLLLLASTLTLAACGGAAESGRPAAKSPDRTSEPTSIEEAEQQIASAKAELGQAAAPGAFESTVPPASDSARPSTEAPRPSTPSKSSSRPIELPSSSARRTENRCAVPCRALSSMRTAVNALCRMAGEGDHRCVDAKHTLADSEGRIAPCSC